MDIELIKTLAGVFCAGVALGMLWTNWVWTEDASETVSEILKDALDGGKNED